MLGKFGKFVRLKCKLARKCHIQATQASSYIWLRLSSWQICLAHVITNTGRCEGSVMGESQIGSLLQWESQVCVKPPRNQADSEIS